MKVRSQGVKKRKSDGSEKTLLKGSFPDNADKIHSSIKTVGCALGLTINLGDFESLRIDVWGASEIEGGESRNDAIMRLADELAGSMRELQEKYS